MLKKKGTGIGFLDGFLVVAMLLVGGFHEYISCALSAVLCCYLIYKIDQNGKIIIHRNLLSLAVSVVVGFYLLSCLWAVDSGMAWIGFWKFLEFH